MKLNKLIILAVLILLISLLFMVKYAFAQDMDLTKAVIHHTASHDVGVSTIDKWHRERGWDGIGYHFVIRSSGDIEIGRSLTLQGAHAKGRNHYIGIALTGYNAFSDEQVKSLTKLLKDLGVNHIERHHEECPGKGLDLNLIRKELK